jgi:predicted nucleic acid-binding protein
VLRIVYFDTTIFTEMGAKKSQYKQCIRRLMQELTTAKARIYTSIITVQELAVASYRPGTVARDTYGDVSSISRIYGITKEVSLTAAKGEAGLKELAEQEVASRDPKKGETREQELERICENRRRKWDCFHIATAQALGCVEIYSTDKKFAKRPEQLGIRSLKVFDPCQSANSKQPSLFDQQRAANAGKETKPETTKV